MTQNYEVLFDVLCIKLRRDRPHTAELLVTMKDVCPAKTAYYAGFVFLYLRVWAEADDRKPLQTLTAADLEDFTFFEEAHGNQRALERFNELLHCYQAETTSLSA